MKLTENERKVFLAMEPGYDYLEVIVVGFPGSPGQSGLPEHEASAALKSLKKKGLIVREGRGRFRQCGLSDEGERIYEEVAA